jgi:pimeloyl-ACP methyl ester carboxylesterase
MSDERETIVFVHGSGDTSQVWQPLIARLEPSVQCIALDLPGHGTRIDTPGPARMSVSDYAADVWREVESHRDLHRICVAGHSLGGAIALQMAATYPSLVSRLALIGTGARLRVAPRLLELAASDSPDADQLLGSLAWAPGHAEMARSYQPAELPGAAPGVLYRDLAACDAFDMMAELDHIDQPAIVITGELDQLTPPKYARYLQEHLPHASLAIIAGAGHYVPYEQPDAVAQVLSSWLSLTH